MGSEEQPVEQSAEGSWGEISSDISYKSRYKNMEPKPVYFGPKQRRGRPSKLSNVPKPTFRTPQKIDKRRKEWRHLRSAG